MKPLTVSKQSLGLITAILAWIFIVQLSAFILPVTYEIYIALATLTLVGTLLLFPSYTSIPIRLISGFFLFIAIFMIQSALPVIQGPDAQSYFEKINSTSLIDLINHLRSTFDLTSPGLVSATITFPITIKSLAGRLAETNPEVIALTNAFLWILSAFSWVNAVKSSEHLKRLSDKRSLTLLIVLLLTTPSVVYWSSVFAKDIATTAVTILAATSAYRRRYVTAFILVILATLLRPYSIIMAIAFLLFLNGSIRLLFLCVLGALTIIIIYSGGDLTPIANIPLTTGFMLLSPDPSNINNWLLFSELGSWTFSPFILTAEALLLSIVIITGSTFGVLRGQGLHVLTCIALGIVLSASALTLIGYHRFQGENYAIGFLGDNMVRKKLSMWPLIITWATLSILYIKDGVKGYRRVQGGLIN